MFERIFKFFRTIHLGHQLLAAPRYWEVSPAEYVWKHAGHESIHFQIEFSSIKRDAHGEFSAEMNVDHAGIRVGSVATLAGGILVIYLGNYFFVPEQMKRRGLATGLLAALVDSFQIAALEATVEDMPVFLEGYFINEGVLFAAALCDGICPTKTTPGCISPSRLNRARKNLMILSRPTKLEPTPG